MKTKIEDWFAEKEERRLEETVKSMRLKGVPEHRICMYLNHVASLYLAELSKRYDEGRRTR